MNKLTMQDRAAIATSDFDPYGHDKEPFMEGYMVGATEQDKIAREEERERCIRLAQECVNKNWRNWLLGIDKDGMIGFHVDDEQIREWLTNGGK